jgi:hypothetical protein
MNLRNFFAELKRRNLYKVAIAYAIVAWLLIQIATQVFPFLQIPDWAIRLIIMLVALGFPVALIFAWPFVNQRGAALDALDGDLHSPFIVDLPLIWMPPFHQLQNEPRFLQLLRETKMAEYWRVAGWGDFRRAKGADDFECVAP